MHRNNFVVSIKCKGSFIREEDGKAVVPFGAEYSIYMKNLDSRDALIRDITVDGKSALGGTRLIIRGKSHIELNGFIRSGIVDRAFKFVTVESAEGKGASTSPHNGEVSVTFSFTKKVEQKVVNTTYKYSHFPVVDPIFKPYIVPWYPRSRGDVLYGANVGSVFRSCGSGKDVKFTNSAVYVSQSEGKPESFAVDYSDSTGRAFSVSSENFPSTTEVIKDSSAPAISEGKTVEGSRVGDNLSFGFIGEVEDSSDTITIFLSGVQVKDEIPTASKYCTSCGYPVGETDCFCSKCGNKLS